MNFKVDDDMEFVAVAAAVWGPFLAGFRREQERVMKQLKKAVQPLREAIQKQQHPVVRRITKEKDIALMAALTAVSKWPDTGQAKAYCEGFPIVGDIGASGVFRPLELDRHRTTTQDLLQGASAFVQSITERPAPRECDKIFELAHEDLDKGFATALWTQKQLDKQTWCGWVEAYGQVCDHPGFRQSQSHR